MRLLIGGYLALFAPLCLGQAPEDEASEPPSPSIETEAAKPEEITVTGEVPGPGMWKVTRADDPEGHVLWILGSAPPTPKKMKWRSKQVEAAIASSQEILLGAKLDFVPDKEIGFFKGLTLLPAALGARKNPDEAKLQDLVPASDYERWLRLKKRFLGRDSGVERWRPIFAANELREEALDDLKLRESGLVSDAVEKLAKTHKIKTTQPSVEFKFSTKDIRAKIKQFSKEQLADLDCFSKILDLVDAIASKETTEARALAWAIGDIEALTNIEPLPNYIPACQAAIMSSQIAQEVVPADIVVQLKAAWLEEAEQALARNKSTFTYMSFAELVTPEGQLATLRTKGYVIEEPTRANADELE